VAPKTIRRDAQLAKAISAIGEASPDAKRSILSGESAISRRLLQELSIRPKEDITEVAERIDGGDFIRGKSRPSVDPPSDGNSNNSAAPHPVETAVRSLTDAFYSELRNHSAPYDTPAIKTALGVLISSLEQLQLSTQ